MRSLTSHRMSNHFELESRELVQPLRVPVVLFLCMVRSRVSVLGLRSVGAMMRQTVVEQVVHAIDDP